MPTNFPRTPSPRFEAGTHSIFLPAEDREMIWKALDFHLRWPSFRAEELACNGTGDLRIHYATLDGMQKIRDAIARPLIITSYYRSPQYNAKVGGSPNSRHLAGMAFDTTTWPSERGRFEMALIAGRYGFQGMGLYDTFTHYDTGPRRWWDERTQKAA